jgi:GNAT superfamily N-acetyltransferase
MSVRAQDVPESLTKRLARYPELPAILVGRLATDLRYQGPGLGRLLVMDALARVQEQSRQVAAFLVIVDAKDQAVVRFYERFGFLRLEDHERRLFLPTRTIPPVTWALPSTDPLLLLVHPHLGGNGSN